MVLKQPELSTETGDDITALEKGMRVVSMVDSSYAQLEQGGEIYKLSRLLGPSSVEMTEEYLKSFKQRAAHRDQEKFSAVAAMDVLTRRKRRRFQDL